MRTASAERGAALPTIAIMLVVILGMAAFAVDLGWLYLNSNRIQKTADAAALAGVVNLPSDFAQAQADASGAASANGFGDATVAAVAVPDNRLQVDVTSAVPTFFMNVFGIESVDITRRSTAQYILPVPLGNDTTCFGCPGSGFWAAINTPRTDKVDGDAFMSDCFGNKGNQASCPQANPDQRDDGYYYAIEVPEGAAASSLSIELFNATFQPTPYSPSEPSDLNAGDGSGFTTTFTVRQPDTTPYAPWDNPPAGCSQSIGMNDGSWSGWNTVCTISNPTEGIWVLQVVASGSQQAANQFSIRASLGGTSTTPRVYGLNDMSLFNNNLGSSSQIKLAQIDPVHAGKTLEVGLYDPGDFSGPDGGGEADVFLSIVSPSGTATCSWYGERNDGSTFDAHSSQPCSIQVRSGTTNAYNGAWVRITIEIPTGYSCSPGCWWYVDYDMSGLSGLQPTDRTTWTARVIGNPVRLVPNGS